MKKLLITLTAVATLILSMAAVSAAELTDIESNMDAETYLEVRMEQLDEALADGSIDQEQYDTLKAHYEETAANEAFGNGPRGYENNDEECVLGDEFLGIFRNENAGLQSGNGNGIGQQLADGTGSGNQNTGSGNQNAGLQSQNAGQRGGSGMNGIQLQDGSGDNDDCILD